LPQALTIWVPTTFSFPFAETGLAKACPKGRNNAMNKRIATMDKTRKGRMNPSFFPGEKADIVFIFEDNPSLPRIWLP
jgi:hypothetical protein